MDLFTKIKLFIMQICFQLAYFVKFGKFIKRRVNLITHDENSVKLMDGVWITKEEASKYSLKEKEA